MASIAAENLLFSQNRFQCKLCTKAGSLFAGQIELDWRFLSGFLLEKLSISTLFHYFDMPSYYIFLLHMYSLVCMNIHSQFNFAFLLAHLSENSVYMSSNQFLKGTHDRYMWVSSIWVHFIIENMICTFLHSQIQELVMYSCFWLQIETN
jgi:hypothetical protein